MQILIKRLTDAEPLVLTVKLDATVGDVKSSVQETLGIPPREQQLVFKKSLLEEAAKPLEKYGVSEGALLALLVVEVPQEVSLAEELQSALETIKQWPENSTYTGWDSRPYSECLGPGIPGPCRITMEYLGKLLSLPSKRSPDPDNPGKKLIEHFWAAWDLSKKNKLKEAIISYTPSEDHPVRALKILNELFTPESYLPTPEIMIKLHKSCEA